MDNRKFVFVGNRGYVLFEMIAKKLDIVAILVIENSFLHHQLSKKNDIEYVVISSKNNLISKLKELSYDILISNGCKYILPVKKLKKALYVNIHPSYLPDLKGKDPIKGAILFNRNSGATCHVMDEGIDTGDIISRKKIEITEDIDSALLFQLAFEAEKIVFNSAYNSNFIPVYKQSIDEASIYYSSQPKDRLIDFNSDFDYILRQVRAFGYKSKGLYFKSSNINYRFFRAMEINNSFVSNLFRNLKSRVVLYSFENSIIFKFNDRIMRFDGIEDMDNNIKPGDYIESGDIEIK